MTITSYLLLSVALFFVMVLFQALTGIKQFGLVRLAGARDNLAEPGLVQSRAKRANANMIENMVVFIPLALIAIHSGTEGLALKGAALFFFARLAYAPLYWLGVPWLRPCRLGSIHCWYDNDVYRPIAAYLRIQLNGY